MRTTSMNSHYRTMLSGSTMTTLQMIQIARASSLSDLSIITVDELLEFEHVIGDFLQALSNIHFYNEWSWNTYPQYSTVSIGPCPQQ